MWSTKKRVGKKGSEPSAPKIVLRETFQKMPLSQGSLEREASRAARHFCFFIATRRERERERDGDAQAQKRERERESKEKQSKGRKRKELKQTSRL